MIIKQNLNEKQATGEIEKKVKLVYEKAKLCNNAVTHRNDEGLIHDIDIDLHMI